MHIRNVSQIRVVPSRAQAESPFMTILGKVQAVAATVVAVAGAVDTFKKSE